MSTVTTQPEALRLSDAAYWYVDDYGPFLGECATELRRLHEVNQELLEALQMVITVVDESEAGIRGEDNYTYTFKTWTRAARAAIAKATGGAA